MVRNRTGRGLPARFGQHIDVWLVDRVSLARKQYGTCTIVSSEGKTRGGAGASKLECKMAWSTRLVRMAAASGDFRSQDEPALPRPPHGQGPRARRPTGWFEYRIDPASESAGSAGCEKVFALAGTAGIYTHRNFGHQHRLFG